MRELTDEFRKEYRKLLDRELIEIYIFGKKEKIPPSVFSSILDRARFYEFNDVKELRKNYGKLQEPGGLPFYAIFWTAKRLVQGILRNREKFNEWMDLETEYGGLYRKTIHDSSKTTLKSILRSPLNEGQIYGVNLRNFRSVQNPLFKAYEFDVIDRTGKIPAVCVYDEYFLRKVMRVPRLYVDLKSQLDIALDAPEDATFSLAFARVDSTRRGKRLKVSSLTLEDGGGRKLPPITPVIRF